MSVIMFIQRKAIGIAGLVLWGMVFNAFFVPHREPESSGYEDTTLRHPSYVRSRGGSDWAAETELISSPLEYAHLIINYHKTGHELAYSLQELVLSNFPDMERENGARPRQHPSTAQRCSHIELPPGKVVVQEAPHFFCDTNNLAEMLLENKGRFHREGEQRIPKRGVKILHLVRDPFSMAISNYNYHSQDPTPEGWVKDKTRNICGKKEFFGDTLAELLLPTLVSPGVDFDKPPIVTKEEFDMLYDKCNHLFRAQRGFEDESYYFHLRQLDPSHGIKLSTLQQMVNGGDIFLMANNIIKLNQIRTIQSRVNDINDGGNTMKSKYDKIQILTMSLSDFTLYPRRSTLKYLNFVYGNALSREEKGRIATQYENAYVERVETGDLHITHGNDNEEMLRKALQNDMIGKYLGNIESVVSETLAADEQNTK
mmetsp:Transcript_11647/g.17492  ORF Transcript_11647/g.17492 Transcript_11647/m.17492 type:complete len:427 (+) Transcript_11647:68-1348(+)